MRGLTVSALLMAGGVLVALLGAGLAGAASRSKAAQGGPLVRQDFAIVVLVIGVVAVIFGGGLLFFRITVPT
jgi:hypothetical protein